jgi:hypothetical protein
MHPISPEQRLFMAVINQQLLDATSDYPWIEPKQRLNEDSVRFGKRRNAALKAWRKRLSERDDARNWLKNERAVRSLCDMAGINYLYVLRKVSELEANNWQSLESRHA